LAITFKTIGRHGVKEKIPIIIFQSDNGHSTERNVSFGGVAQAPIEERSNACFEGGMRVPAAISWAGEIPVGEVMESILQLIR